MYISGVKRSDDQVASWWGMFLAEFRVLDGLRALPQLHYYYLCSRRENIEGLARIERIMNEFQFKRIL